MKKKNLLKLLKIGIIIFLVLLLIPFIINLYVIFKTSSHIYNTDDLKDTYDYALVLGCGLKKDGSPSLMLKDRLNKVIELYESGIVKEIIISGEDSKNYSEVNAMENYLLKNGVLNNQIIRDNIGNSTRASLINFKENYPDKSVIIITQKYHMYRALYIADSININAIGVTARVVRYNGQTIRDLREILARVKDYLLCIF